MVRRVSACVGCDRPCQNCTRIEAKCDYCNHEISCDYDKLYHFEGGHICEECLLEQFEQVDFMNAADSYDERD